MFYICGKYQSELRALNYCTGGLAYTTRRFRITSFMVTIAKNVDITTMQGTRKIVRKNIVLDNMKYVAINVSEKSVFVTDKECLSEKWF